MAASNSGKCEWVGTGVFIMRYKGQNFPTSPLPSPWGIGTPIQYNVSCLGSLFLPLTWSRFVQPFLHSASAWQTICSTSVLQLLTVHLLLFLCLHSPLILCFTMMACVCRAFHAIKVYWLTYLKGSSVAVIDTALFHDPPAYSLHPWPRLN